MLYLDYGLNHEQMELYNKYRNSRNRLELSKNTSYDYLANNLEQKT